MKRILVIDGQGGSIGKLIIEQLKSLDIGDKEILAVGTNSVATQSMIKTGADEAATGENPVIYNSQFMDYIIGPIGISFANSLNGEITPAMATAVSSSQAKKILVPINKCNHYIVGFRDDLSLQELIKLAISYIEEDTKLS